MAVNRKTTERQSGGYERMRAATLRQRRRHFRETTPGERIEEAFELNELAIEIREAMLRARARR